MKIHSLRNGRRSRAQFFFFGQVPLNANCTTLAPCRWAISIEPSVLWESTTRISSAHFTESRQRGRLAASFLIGMMTETGTRVFIAAAKPYTDFPRRRHRAAHL